MNAIIRFFHRLAPFSHAVLVLCASATVMALPPPAMSAGEPGSSAKRIPPPPSFQEILERANHDVATEKGKAFDEQIGREFARKSREAVKACVTSGGPPPYPPLQFLVVIDKNGGVTQVLARPDAPAAMCIMAMLQKEKFPNPPFAPFHDVMNMTFGDL